MTGALRRFTASALHDGGFVHGAVVEAQATLYTAGVSPLDPNGEVVSPGDAPGQTQACLNNLAAILADGGSDPRAIAKLSVYVATTDAAELGSVWRVVDGWFAETPPAIVIGVSVLPYPGQLVEVEAVAAVHH